MIIGLHKHDIPHLLVGHRHEHRLQPLPLRSSGLRPRPCCTLATSSSQHHYIYVCTRISMHAHMGTCRSLAAGATSGQTGTGLPADWLAIAAGRSLEHAHGQTVPTRDSRARPGSFRVKHGRLNCGHACAWGRHVRRQVIMIMIMIMIASSIRAVLLRCGCVRRTVSTVIYVLSLSPFALQASATPTPRARFVTT